MQVVVAGPQQVCGDKVCGGSVDSHVAMIADWWCVAHVPDRHRFVRFGQTGVCPRRSATAKPPRAKPFVVHHNIDPRPFIWTAYAKDIQAKVTWAKAALAATAGQAEQRRPHNACPLGRACTRSGAPTAMDSTSASPDR